MMRRAENDASRSRRNVAHHYDLDGRLYALFLDSDRQYSCAYFDHPDASLEEAQLAKKRHIAAKLLVDPGHSVLDIGSGWGGLGLYLAQVAGAGSVGASPCRRSSSTRRASGPPRAGLQDRVQFELEDYRATTAPSTASSRSACSSMWASPSYDAYFQACRGLLNEDGVCCCTRSAALGHALPDQSLDHANTSSPAGICRSCRRSCRPSSGPG